MSRGIGRASTSGRRCLTIVWAAVVLVGCPSGPSAPQTPAAPTAITFMDEAAVLKADASTAAVQSAIQVLALDSTQRATLRLACLRKLEEVRSPATVATAQTLALDPSSSRDTNWLRTNATELLFRESTAPGSPPSSATTEAQAALAVVQAQSLDMAILVARLQRKTGGK